MAVLHHIVQGTDQGRRCGGGGRDSVPAQDMSLIRDLERPPDPLGETGGLVGDIRVAGAAARRAPQPAALLGLIARCAQRRCHQHFHVRVLRSRAKELHQCRFVNGGHQPWQQHEPGAMGLNRLTQVGTGFDDRDGGAGQGARMTNGLSLTAIGFERYN